MPYKSKEDIKLSRRKFYLAHTEAVKKEVRKRKRTIRHWFNEYKRVLKCELCSENHPATLDFHHHSHKDYSVAHMVAYGYSTRSIEKELKKCKVLCSNCHRKLHHAKDNL